MQVKPGWLLLGSPKPSPSASGYHVVGTSATPQPHIPGAIFPGALGQPSIRSQVPSASASGRGRWVHTPPTTISNVHALPSSGHGIVDPAQVHAPVTTSPVV